jgi:hypothetical protein
MNEAIEYLESLEEDSEVLLESGFARIMEIISGLVPAVRTFAILTWENPQNKKLSAEENNKLNAQLEDYLNEGAWGYVKIKGRYGNLEHPFFIMNLTKSDAVQIGITDGDQESVVWAEVKGELDVVFHLIHVTGAEETQRMYKRVGPGTKQYYSEVKGKKFKIPFFTKADQGKVMIDKGEGVFSVKQLPGSAVVEAEARFERSGLINEENSAQYRWSNRGSLKIYLYNESEKTEEFKKEEAKKWKAKIDKFHNR